MNKTLALLLASVVLAQGVQVPLVPRGHHRKAKAVPMLKGSATLIKLAQTPKVVVKPFHQWVLPFLLPPSTTNYWWRAVRTVDLTNWVAVGPVYYGGQSTNSDVWTTNLLKMEFWRLHRVDQP